MEYLSGVEVSDFADIPQRLTRLRVGPQTYAVFCYGGHIAEILSVWHSIWNGWFPTVSHAPVDAPMFERYDAAFDPRTGRGCFEIWIPLQTRAGS